MNLYAESSAILSWILDEPAGNKIVKALGSAEHIISSDLTLIECDRVILRALASGALNEAEAADRKAHLIEASSHWHILNLSPEIVDRARQPFPGEPIRTLDAIHVASALVARSVLVGLEILTLDDRIRKTAKGLGMGVVPA